MIKNYIKVALRNLQRYKGYTAINIVGLALSMTCGILIFTLVRYHLSFDNFHHEPGRIYRIVTEEHHDEVNYVASVPSPLGKVFRDDYSYAEKVGRIATMDEPLITIKKGNENIMFKEKEGAAFTEPEFFDIFNYPLLKGDKKTVLSEINTAIITESLAKKYFGDNDPINQTIRVNNKFDCKITGILKDFPTNSDRQTKIYIAYSSLKYYNDWLARDDAWGGITSEMQCFVRLKPGVSIPRVEADMFTYVKKYRPRSKNVHHYRLQPLADMHFNPHYDGRIPKQMLWVFSFIGFFLVLTACVNFVNLATAQALKRSKEVGVRKVLGSVRRQIFWQFIAETWVITFCAIILSVLLSGIALPFVNDLFHTQMTINLWYSWQLLSFLALLMLTVTFLSGSYPGFILAGFKPVEAIKGKISQRTIGRFNLRRTLIVLQFTISQVLVIGMIVVATQMDYAKNTDPGFNKDSIVMLPNGDGTLAEKTTLKNKIAELPGVKDITLCFTAPGSNDNWSTSFKYDNRPENEPGLILVRPGDDKYVSTFDLKIIAGRNIFPADSMREFLVNETLLAKLGIRSPEEVLGKTLAINGGNWKAPIVGVVKDFHTSSFHDDISPICISTIPSNYGAYAVKINLANSKSTMEGIQKTWTAMHPNELYESKFLNDQLAEYYGLEGLMLKLIEVFSCIAIFIGCLGLYGLISFMASQKTKEIGIRKVLGGRLAGILWIFGREFSRLIVIALLIAGPLGWWLMNNWLQDYKFRISIGPWVFIATILISMIVAILAVGYQAMKAASANPVKSLRAE